MTARFPISGPLSLGDLLDRAFRLYRARFGVFLLTAAIFLVPLSVLTGLLTGTFITDSFDALQALASQPNASPEQVLPTLFSRIFGFAGGLLLLSLLGLIFNGIVTLALTSQSVATLHNDALPLRTGIRRGLRRFWAFVGMNIARWLITAGATLVAMVPLILLVLMLASAGILVGLTSGNVEGPAGIVAGIGLVVMFLCGYILFFLLLIAPGIYLSARWIVATPVLVAEDQGPIDALRRSWRLTRGNVLRSVGYVVLLYVIMALVISFPTTLLQQLLLVLTPTSALGIVTSISAAISSLFSIVWTPFYAGAIVLLYYDLRVRRESYDLEMRIAQMETEMERGSADAHGFDKVTG